MNRTRVVTTRPAVASGWEAVAAELHRLTRRDRLLLDVLDEHQVLTTDHVVALAFGSRNRALGRLGQLYRRGLVDRFRHYQRPGSQSWRWVLGPVGAAILAAARGQPLPRPAAVREHAARLAASPRLGHLVGCNGFGCALAGHARTHPGYRLARWWAEPRATRAAGRLVRPDGHGVWCDPACRAVGWWLEHDTGTEPLRRVVAKLADYATLAGTDWGLPVLFWLPTSLREAHLADRMATTGIPSGLTVATAAADYAADHGGPAGPVWHTPGRAARVALADLPPLPTDHGLSDVDRGVSDVDGDGWGG